MSDLIDRQELRKDITTSIDYCEDILEIIDRQPNAEPKKGKWINHRCDDGHHIADCTLCGETMQW